MACLGIEIHKRLGGDGELAYLLRHYGVVHAVCAGGCAARAVGVDIGLGRVLVDARRESDIRLFEVFDVARAFYYI